MVARNAALFIALQFASRFLNSFLTTAARFHLLEAGSVGRFAQAQVATSLARTFASQMAGLLTDNAPLKRLYVGVEACNIIVACLMLLPGSGVLGLMVANTFLGIILAFSQPVTKSMPPAVASEHDLSLVNSWDLTCDKIARYLAPIVYAVISSQLGFRGAALIAAIAYAACVCLRTMVVVERGLERKQDAHSHSTVIQRLFAVFRKLWEGIKSLQTDRTLCLLILNTLITNVFIYPLSSILFPVLFKRMAESSDDSDSVLSGFLTAMIETMGIKKRQAWQNYTSLVGLGGVFGPVFSSVITHALERCSADAPSLRVWTGVNVGIGGQLLAGMFLCAALMKSASLSVAALVLLLFACWVMTLTVNNIYTVYFTSFQQKQLNRDLRGRFIANIMMVFTLGNSCGTLLFGRALDTPDVQDAVQSAVSLLFAGLLIKVVIWAMLHWGGTAKAAMKTKPD